MGEIFEGSLEAQSMELLMQVHENDEMYKARLVSLRAALEKIDQAFHKRLTTIRENAAKYQQDKVADMEYNCRVATRKEIEELVKARGFTAEIDECVTELKKQEPRNDVQEMTQVMKEIEIRQLMFAAGQDFAMQFQAAIIDGDPLTITAIENSPAPLPIDEGILADAKERMESILKPVLYAKYEALKQAQGTLEGMANTVTPINSNFDPLAEMAKG